MSLDWSLTAIADYLQLCWEPVPADYQPAYDETTCEQDGQQYRLRAVTQALIYALMGIGINRISVRNLREVQVRLELWQDVVGPLLTRATGNGIVRVRVTPAEVEQHIGLATNVSNESWSVLCKKLRRVAERRLGG